MRRFILLFVISLAAGCGTGPEQSTITRSVGRSRPPDLSAEHAVYHKLGNTNVDSLLTILLNNGILVVDVWNPIGGSPCRAMCATASVIVKLVSPDVRIMNYGFDSDAREWCINCGVSHFEHYHLQR